MATDKQDVIDKSTWPDGPWQSEPDRWEGEHAGFPLLAVRHSRSGHWCGYVAVPPTHPAYGKDYDDVDVQVHGGLTYADKCQGSVCHVPKPGEPDDVWWFGFDCGHAGDLSPFMKAALGAFGFPLDGMEYRTLEYVQVECSALAAQLAVAGVRKVAGDGSPS